MLSASRFSIIACLSVSMVQAAGSLATWRERATGLLEQVTSAKIQNSYLTQD